MTTREEEILGTITDDWTYQRGAGTYRQMNPKKLATYLAELEIKLGYSLREKP